MHGNTTYMNIFHYNHYHHQYQPHHELHPQVHRDTGLLTLLPCATAPGIEILDKRTKSFWIPLEEHLVRIVCVCV